MFGAFGRSLTESSVTFVSQAAMKKSEMLGLAKTLLPVGNTRNIGKHSMILNSAIPRMEINPETYEVRADGRLLTCDPAIELPLAQRYFMYGHDPALCFNSSPCWAVAEGRGGRRSHA